MRRFTIFLFLLVTLSYSGYGQVDYEVSANSITLSPTTTWPKKFRITERHLVHSDKESDQPSRTREHALSEKDWEIHVLYSEGSHKQIKLSKLIKPKKLKLKNSDKLVLSRKQKDLSFWKSPISLISYQELECVMKYFPDASIYYPGTKQEEPENITGVLIGEKTFVPLYEVILKMGIDYGQQDIHLEFVDADTGLPITENILIEINFSISLTEEVTNILNYTCELPPIELMAFDQRMAYEKIRLTIKELIEPKTVYKRTTKGMVSLHEKIFNDYKLEVTARANGRLPLGFTINGSLSADPQSYEVNWPSLSEIAKEFSSQPIKPNITPRK